MTLVVSTATILVAAIIASIISGFLPRLSINYVSIILGVAIALIAPLNHLVAPFHSEIFMYVVAPLIYFEGQSTRINQVRQSLGRIVSTAVLLVLIMTVASGAILAWLGIPVALAGLLAALSTSTDATATDAVTEGLVMPRRINSLLKMESLFNDASSIILVSAAALWVEKGNLNYQQTVTGFLISAIGGILVGIAAAFIMISFRRGLQRLNLWAANAQNMLFLITPFFVYFLAEKLAVSGIIAVVCAGLMQNSESANSRFVHPRQFHTGLVLMNLVQEMFNNIVFVILGILIVRILRADLVQATPGWSWIMVGFVLYGLNLVIRFIYGLIDKLGWQNALLFALGGVRGAITLALVFAVADSVSTGQFRQLILAETLVIVLSMVVPTIIFPFILPHDIGEDVVKQRIIKIRVKMVEHGIQAIDKIYLPDDVRERIMYDLRDQQSANSLREFWRRWLHTSHGTTAEAEQRELEQRALLWAFQAERSYLDMISQKEEMRDYVYQLYNDVLLAESILIDPENRA